MLKKEKSLIVLLFLIFQISLKATNNFKGETEHISASPFVMFQENDSTLIQKYKLVKKLFKVKEYNKSLKKGLEFLNEAKKKNIELEYLGTFLIGDIFSKLNNHDKALLYYKEALKIHNLNNDLYSKEMLSYEKGFERNINKTRILLKIGAKYQSLKKNDSSIYFYNKIIKMSFVDDIFLSFKSKVYSNLSGIYREDSLYLKARDFAKKALSIQQKLNDKVAEASTLNNLANIYLEEKKYNEAKRYYFKGLDLLENDRSTKAINFKKSLYYNLAWTLYLMKDYKAYDYQEKSYILKDSLRNKEIEHLVKGVFENHQIELEKEKVNLAKQQLELKKAQEKKTKLYFSALIFLILIVSGVIVYNYKLRQKNLSLRLDQTEQAQASKLEKLRSESQVRILNATLDGKEAERKQIAETLHDSVSSLLSSANLHLQATRMQFNGDTPIEIDKTQKIIIEASQSIRDLSHTLVSSVLLKFGLKYAIKDMADKFSNSQISIETDIENVVRYHQGFEIKVNNIIQEFVNNILKHSKASKAIVRIADKNDNLHIVIQDNGTGFDKKVIPEKDGLGINQIDARIQMMKGKFVINSSFKTGTKIEVVLPIQKKEMINLA